jgi:Carboxypeptidase regulatory-like domain/TonB dependent receptor-like, beta-barrel
MKAIAACAALLWLATPTSAQTATAAVAGIVTDQTGARLAEAVMTIVHTENGRSLTVTSGADGEYRALALLPGEYVITAERSGFARATRRIVLLVSADATVNFELAIASVGLGATVTAETPLVEVARSQPSSVVTQRQIDRLPVLERNFLVLAQLLPGAAPITSTVSRFAVTKFGGVADQRSGYTTLVDGGDVDDAQWGSPTINVGQDAVQEFKVFRTSFDAQYGHALNAVVTVATRSGTNRLAGTAFYFGRDDALNARNVFATTKPPFSEHRVGGSVGGPVARDRTHFFAAYEQDIVNNVRIIALPPTNPLAATENGVFPARADDRMATLRLDHRFASARALSLRYNQEHQRLLRANATPTSDTNQTDVFNRSHSLVGEYTWSPASRLASALRVHWLNHTLGTTARNQNAGIIRPSGSLGQTNRDSQLVPRTKLAALETVYLRAGRHDLKFGGEAAFATHDLDAHVFEYGVFRFTTEAPFNPDVSSTWPVSFEQQRPTVFTYRSRELSAFVQDDWSPLDRLRVNAGLRYDLDLNLRINDFYQRELADPALAELGHFISANRGTDTNNVQPRVGATWDLSGDGRAVVRGGTGLYVTRNRPWFQLRAMNQAGSSVVRITDPALLRNYPNVDAVLGGRSLESFLASGGARQIGTVIPDDFVPAYAVNSAAGVGWQFSRTAALDVDYVHSHGAHQVGSVDRNLPASGAISAANPRPAPQFSQVVMLENYSKSWYDALETQLRANLRGTDSLQVSYTFSRSYLDGVDFFLTTRGTQRTPHERGYNPTDQRHNLTLAAAVTLPWEIQLNWILKLISGSPIKVQAGVDLDGDTTVTGDLPPGIPMTVGRDRVEASLTAINEYRASLRLLPIDGTLLGLDPYRTLDMRATKVLKLGSNRRLEVLLEAFNLTNAVNFRVPLGAQPEAGVNINSASFLIRTVARDARQIQWGARYRF